jgi:hypothetical protein
LPGKEIPLMSRTITIPLVALVVWVGLAARVQADMISGTFSGDAALTPTGTPGVFVQNFTGDGDDTVFGSFTAHSQSTVDFSNPPHITISNGALSEMFAQGVLSGTSSGDGTASGQGTATFTIDFVITGGTGAFAGAMGEANLTGTITSTSATTESISGTYTGSITLAPEPASAILLASGGLAFIGLAGRRRRRAA